MGIKVAKSTPIFVDNMGVVLNASNPGSMLNKKSVALCAGACGKFCHRNPKD
jgi:hypothetical protein